MIIACCWYSGRFPPLLLNPLAFDALFWLGFEIGSKRLMLAEDVKASPLLMQDSHSEALGSISAGSWMRVACGLQTGFTPDCAAALKGLNKAMLKTVALAVPGKRGAHHFLEISGHDQDAKADFVAMEPFYMDPISGFATTADRVSVLEQLESVMGGQTLCSLMAHRFLALFSESDINKQLMVRCRVQRYCVLTLDF